MRPRFSFGFDLDDDLGERALLFSSKSPWASCLHLLKFYTAVLVAFFAHHCVALLVSARLITKRKNPESAKLPW